MQCYLPPGRGDIPAVIPARGGLKTRDHEKYGGGKRRTGKRGTKSQGWKRQYWKTRDQIAGVEKAGLENTGPKRRGGKGKTGKRRKNFQGGKRTTTVYGTLNG